MSTVTISASVWNKTQGDLVSLTAKLRESEASAAALREAVVELLNSLQDADAPNYAVRLLEAHTATRELLKSSTAGTSLLARLAELEQ